MILAFWHEQSPFQSVAVQAVDWYDDSEPLGWYFNPFGGYFCQFLPDPL